MASLAHIATALQTVLTTGAAQAAAATGCVQRTRCFSGATWVQTLVFGCLATPEPRLTDLCRMAATLGVSVSPQAIAQRFTRASADCLQQVLADAVDTMVRADPVAIPLLDRFAAVEVVDTTSISLPPALAETWPGCGNGSHQPAAALKLGVRLELRHGTLTGPDLLSGRTHDRAATVAAVPLAPDTLRLADLGFWSVDDLATMTDADGWWLSRLQAQTAVLAPDGARLDLDAALATTTTTDLELAVRLGVTAQVPARLLAHRVPPAVADTRRRRIRAEAKRRGQTPRRERLTRADWTLLVTNVPATRLTPAEALVLARARWQIELLFKLWKSHGRIAAVRSDDPWRVLTEISAKLVAMVIQHWVLLRGCWHCPERSLVIGAATVRAAVPALAVTLDHPRQVRQVLDRLVASLAVGPRRQRRRAHPSLAQLLMAGDDVPLA